MKFVVLFCALFVLVPLVAVKASKSELWRKVVIGLIAFDLFNPQHINIVSDENYRGDSRGIEVTTVDLMILAMFVCQRLRKQPGFGGTRFVGIRLAYLTAVLLSFTATPDAFRSFYSLWKLLRMFFAFDVLATAFADMGLLSAGLYGLAAGVISQGLMAFRQKYVFHMVRVVGSQSHPNSLAMICNLAFPVAFALLLSGKGRRVALITVAIAGLCDIFSLSRGGMMMFVLASAIVFTGSFLRGMTRRKVTVLALSVVAGIAVLAKSADTIINRFVNAPKESEQARVLFNAAAKMMANEHPFGIGINQYSNVLDHGGYADRLGIAAVDRNGIAHHIYWLTAAELGYFGLATFLLMLGTVLVVGMRSARIPGVRGDVALGLVAGLTVTYLQGTAEWIMRQTTFSYAFWLVAAMIASIWTWGKANRRPATA